MRIFALFVVAAVASLPAVAGSAKVYERMTRTGPWTDLNVPRHTDVGLVVLNHCLSPHPKRHALKSVAPDGTETIHLCEPIRAADLKEQCRDNPSHCENNSFWNTPSPPSPTQKPKRAKDGTALWD